MQRSILRGLLRFGLGFFILASGLGKALDEAGFVGVLRTYQLGLPDAPLWPVALGVTAFELAVGAWILSGRALYAAGWAAAALNVGYFVLLGVSLARGLEIQNCGCFGVFFARPLRWYSPLEDLALVALSLLLVKTTSSKQPSYLRSARAER